MGSRYAQAGVDTEAEGRFVDALKTGAGLEDLPGIFAKFNYRNGQAIGISMDGVGSKLLAYLEDPQTLHLAGYDLGAMLLHDLAAEFIRPLLFADYVAVNRPDPEIGLQLGRGLRAVAEQTKALYLAGGETASLPDQIREGTFDWAGTVVGTEPEEQHREWIAKREAINKDVTLIGVLGLLEGVKPVRPYTLQSNGLTLARQLPEGYHPHLRVPSVLATDFIMDVRDADAMHFVVPITGGGYTNIQRVLAGKELDAEVTFSRDGIPPIFRIIQEELDVAQKEMFETFNMGNVLVIGTDQPGKVIDIAGHHPNIVREIGQLIPGKGDVIIHIDDEGRETIALEKYSI